MENKAKLIGLLSIALLIFTVAAIAISPPAFASKGQVLFTDVNGQPVKGWRTGEMMFVTVNDPDENRDSDEVELLQGTFTDELNDEHPLVEIIDPNTGDRETSSSFVLQETGVSTGEFRNFPGLYVAALGEGESATPDNGRLEVKDNDTIYVYYTDPSDPSDVDADLAKIGFSYAEIKITDRAGKEVPLFNVGNDVFVTVWDDDENRDPTAVEAIEGVTLMNPRMVNEGIAGGVEKLRLVETGPNTGVFRNVDGVLLQDFKGSIPQSDTDLVLPVLDKDTIVAFYRAPMGGVAPPPPAGTRTDCASDTTGALEFCRTVPVKVAPGASFTVTVTLTNTSSATLNVPAFSDKLPSGFTPAAGAKLTNFAASLDAGKSVTFTYGVTAGSTEGTFAITGTAKATGLSSFTLASDIIVQAGAAATSTVSVIAQGTDSKSDGIEFARTVPDQVAPGATFMVSVKITNKTSNTLDLVAYKDTLPGGFTPASVSNFEQSLAPGATKEWTYKATAPMTPGEYTITGKARAIGMNPVQLDSKIVVSAAPVVGGGLGDPNDPSDFALDTADIAEPNPSTVTFTDENGVEKSEFRIAEDLYITVRDDDENTDSDLAETIHVDVIDPNGGRELNVPLVETGLNTGVFRNRDALKIVGVNQLGCTDTTSPMLCTAEQDGDSDGIIAVNNRDAIYVVYADKESPTYDPFDISYGWARIYDCEVFSAAAGGPSCDGPQGAAQGENKIWFTSESWNPIDKVKKGQELFIKIEECDQNEFSELADSFIAILYDRHTGDVETVRMVETGPNTGVFHGQGVSMWRPEEGMSEALVGDGTLQIEDRDTIFVMYQDQNNYGDFSLAKAELAPRPIGPGPTASTTRFTDAQGRDVAKYVVGDTVYVTVDDADENRTPGVVDTIPGALVVENADTGASVTVDLVETGPDSGVFLSEPITTGPAGSGAMLEVAPGQTLNATYQDPDDPTDSSTDNVAIESAALKVEEFVVDPNPMSVTTQFKAVGTGIEKVEVWVYDLSGRLVYDSGELPGASVTWDGGGMANGLYLYMVEAFGKADHVISEVGKLVILR